MDSTADNAQTSSDWNEELQRRGALRKPAPKLDRDLTEEEAAMLAEFAAGIANYGRTIQPAVMAATDEAIQNVSEAIYRPWESTQTAEPAEGKAPALSGAGDRAYWTDVVKQAESSGNITRYLDSRNIPKSTYYTKKKLYRL